MIEKKRKGIGESWKIPKEKLSREQFIQRVLEYEVRDNRYIMGMTSARKIATLPDSNEEPIRIDFENDRDILLDILHLVKEFREYGIPYVGDESEKAEAIRYLEDNKYSLQEIIKEFESEYKPSPQKTEKQTESPEADKFKRERRKYGYPSP